MSKSLGNFITVDDVLTRYRADILKLFFLQTHYRSPADFSWDRLIELKEAFNTFYRFFQKARGILTTGMVEPPFKKPTVTASFEQRLFDAMDDDLNTPKALGVLFELVDEGTRYLDKATTSLSNRIGAIQVQQCLLDFGRQTCGLFGSLEGYENILSATAQQKLLGLLRQYPEAIPVPVHDPASDTSKQCVDYLVAHRDFLRRSGEYQKADEIRAKLKEMGVILEDGPTKTTWWVKV